MKKNNNHNPSPITRQAVGAIALLLVALAMLVIALIACTPQALTEPDAPTDPTDARTLRIGSLSIGSPTTADMANNPTTRIGIDDGAFTEGDEILVSAKCYKPGGITRTGTAATRANATIEAIYTLTAAGWQLNPDEPEIPVDLIVSGTTPTIDSWGGKATPPESASYNDQSTDEKYRSNDWLSSVASTVKITGRTLSATMQHKRVDVVVNITDDAPVTLPTNATLTLKCGGGGSKDIKTWRSGTTGTTTTFRACINLEDVPGITTATDGSTTGTVADNSLLGTLTYTPEGGAQVNFNINYSITPGTGGGTTPVTITPGMRITVSVASNLTTIDSGTATVTSWVDIDGGDAGTSLPTTSTGESPLDLKKFNADNPVWMITGGATGTTTDQQAAVLANVKTALEALNNNTLARIHLLLTNFAGTIGSYAFYNCTALTTVDAPKATSIGGYAFCNCTALTRLELTQRTATITVDATAFFNSPTENITLVLASNDPLVLAATGVTVTNGNMVTFNNGTPDAADDDVTFTFAAVEYAETINP